jgi:lipopolysaccharide export system permease protein
VKKAEAADVRTAGLHPVVQDTVPKRAAADTAHRDTTRKAASDSAARAQTATPAPPRGPNGTVILGTSRPPAAGTPGAAPVKVPVQTQQQPGTLPPPGAAPATLPPPAPGTVPPPAQTTFKDPFLAKTASESLRAIAHQERGTAEEIADRAARVVENKLRLDTSRRAKNRYEIEIHKKFALAAACLIFVVLGAPLALYYVGLIGGESLANKGLVPPFWAMWGTNVVLTVVGIVLLFRMGREDSSGRGGNWGDRIDALRDWVRARRGQRRVLTEEAA